MFGLFKKKERPLTVEEIEDALYEGFLKFVSLNSSDFNEIIPSFKRKHPKQCPQSLLLDLEKMHEDEIYSLIWTFIIYHMLDGGLKVNLDIFDPYTPQWEVLDTYIQKARAHFKEELEFSNYWQRRDPGAVDAYFKNKAQG